MKRLNKAVLILALEIILILPAFFNQKIQRGVKSIDEYWTETGLTSKELESLITDDVCYSEEKAFLACVNTISTMAERYNLVLNEQGQLAPMNRKEVESRLTEKKELSMWAKVYRSAQGPEIQMPVSFIQLWKELSAKYIHKKERAAVIATGINGYLSVYRDPHSYIIPLAFYEEVIANGESKVSHIGFISRRVRDYAVIRKVYEGSSADLAGLKKGDKIFLS